MTSHAPAWRSKVIRPTSVAERAGLSSQARIALSVHAAAAAAPFTLLLFFRTEIAERLNLRGAVVGEASLLGGVAVLAVLLAARQRGLLPAGVTLILGSAVATVGLALMAWTIELGIFVVAGLLVAIGSGPALVTSRIVLTLRDRSEVRFRVMSWYWGAVALGAGWPLGLRIIAGVAVDTLFWLSAASMAVATVLLIPHALLHDDDSESEPTASLTDVPWVRRSVFAAVGAGIVIIGGADSARDLLVGEWQRSVPQTAAVLAAAPLGAALICLFGPWYHRLHRLQGDRRADAIGIQLVVAGGLVLIGGLSFTYIGLIVAWTVAGAALGLAAVGLDSAVFASVSPVIRRLVAARQVVAFAAGGLIGSLFNGVIISGWSDQWKIALTGLPLIIVGWHVRRFASSALDRAVAVSQVDAITVPRRTSAKDASAPLLQIDHLDVAYGTVQVLFDVNLTVDPGQVVALIGPNGAGKTTLLRAISGLEPASSGRVLYAGLDITRTRPTWRVGMGLHQIVGGAAIVPDLTVIENIRLFAHSVPAAVHDERIDEAVELFPVLAARLDQSAATLSGGEQQMLALSKAIIVQPRLLLIDEFSLGLAPLIVANLLPVVRSIARAGTGVLLVEQSVNVALSIADHAYVIEKGAIGYSASAAELRERPDLLRAAYLEGLVQALDS